MRLSDIKGERTLEVIADIIDPIANIAGSDAAAALFKRERLPEGEDAKAFLTQRIRKALPDLIRDSKSDIIAILAAVEGVSTEEYSESLNLAKLIKDCADVLTDEVFIQLFISAQSETASGSAQGNSVVTQ